MTAAAAALIRPSEGRALAMDALPQQIAFWRDFTNERRLAVVGALGQGKTRGLIIKDLCLHLYNHRAALAAGERTGLRSMLVSPTFGMVQDILIPEFERVIQHELEIPIKIRYGQRPRIDWPRSFGYAQTLLRSAEKPSRLVGTNLSHVGFDEPGLMTVEAWKKGSVRARDNRAACRQRFATGTPEGINWFADRFDRPKPPYYRIQGRLWHATYSHYPAQIREDFAGDEAYLESYLEGRFVPLLSGRTYRAFRESVHVEPCEYDPTLPLVLSCDFNVDHMSWTISQLTDGECRTIDEIRMRPNSQTEDAAREFCDRWGEQAQHRTVIITGDASGEARSTSGDIDYDTILEVLRGRGVRRLKLRIPSSNPRVKDRVDNANYHLSGRGFRIVIAPHCTHLIRDLVAVVWTPTGRELDKSNQELTHMSDAWSYMLWKLLPQWTVRRRRAPLPTSRRLEGDNMATEAF